MCGGPGGETIAKITPAFSNDGSSTYVTNGATGGETYPNGHPCVGFPAAEGPGVFRHNGEDPDPWDLEMTSPTIDPVSGNIYVAAGDAVTSVTGQGEEFETVQSVGPRTPFDETDLQVVSISRTQRFPEIGDICTFEFVRTWDGELHEIAFAIDYADARPANNALAIDTKSVAFLSYIARPRTTSTTDSCTRWVTSSA